MAIRQTISLEGLQTVTGELKNLADVGESAFERIRAAVEGGGGGLEGIAKNFLKVGSALTSLTGAVTVFTGLTAALVGLTVSASNTGEEFENLAAQLGTTIENSSALISSFARAGADVNGLANQLRRAAVNISTEWAAIQHSVREAGLKTIANNIAVAQSINNVAKVSVTAAEQEHNAALQRQSDTLAVADAQSNLDDLLEKRRIRGGGERDPELEAERARAKEEAQIAKARLQVAQAEQKAKEDAAQAETKAAEQALALQAAQLAAAKAQLQADEDRKNSITNLVGFVNDLAAGLTNTGRKVNATVDNMFKGIIASAAGLDASLGPIEGDISNIGSPTVFNVLLKTADVLKTLESNTERVALASKLLGRRVGQEEVSFFAQGSEAVLKYIENVKKLGLEFTGPMAHATQAFRVSLFTFEDTIARLKDRIGAVFAPVFGPFFDLLGSALAKNKDLFVGWANTLANTVKPTLDSIIRVLSGEATINDKWLTDIIDGFKRFGTTLKDIVVPALKSVIDVIGFVAKEINNMFGTNLDATSLIFVVWLTKILGGFRLLSTGLVLLGGVFAAFGARAGIALAPLLLLTAGIAAGFLALLAVVDKSTFEGVKQLTTDLVELGKKILSNFGKPVEDSTKAADQDFAGLVTKADELGQHGKTAGDQIATGQQTAQAAIKATGTEVEKLKTGIDATFRSVPGAAGLPSAGPIIDLTGQGGAGLIDRTGQQPQQPQQQAAEQSAAQTQQAFQTASDKIKQIWTELIAFISDTSKITEAFSSLPDALAAPFQTAKDTITSTFGTIATEAENMSKRIIQAAQQAAQAIQQISSGAGGSLLGSQPTSLAGGGKVVGPGTWTSDSVPAWLSRDEFVQPALRVHQYGVGFMEAIRKGLLSKDAVRMLMGDMRGFSLGGLPSALGTMPRFAAGGAVGAGSMRTLQLVLGGQTFNTTGPTKVIDALEREAALHKIASTGIPQSFVGRS